MRFSAVVLLLGLVRTGCSFVTPQPPQGVPVPSISLEYTQDDPISGLVTIMATAANFSPVDVSFRVDGASPTVDDTAPYEFTIDTADLGDGSHLILASGSDGTYTARRLEVFVTANRPNFVVVLVDDLDETTSPYWDALPQTKALIADAGMTFTNAFAPDPVCCPARSSILTGNYPHNTGVYDNTPPDGSYTSFRGAAELDTVATRLQAQGYRTALIGKYLNGYEQHVADLPPGWDDWFGLGSNALTGYFYQFNLNGTVGGNGTDPDDYVTDVVAGHALDFLDSTEANDGRRFFLFVSPTAPHAPLPPAPRHTDHQWVADPVPTRPNFDEADVSDKPTWIRDGLPPLDQAALDALDADHQNRMGSLLAVDELVA